jgi:hypothetical protein
MELHNQSDLNPSEAVQKLDTLQSEVAILPKTGPEEKDPFGDESQTGVKYKTMAWW